MEEDRVKEQRGEMKRREAIEEALASELNSGLEMFAKQIGTLETAVHKKEDEMREEMENEAKELKEEFAKVSRRLHETRAGGKRRRRA